jgi:hypothetical protein
VDGASSASIAVAIRSASAVVNDMSVRVKEPESGWIGEFGMAHPGRRDRARTKGGSGHGDFPPQRRVSGG